MGFWWGLWPALDRHGFRMLTGTASLRDIRILQGEGDFRTSIREIECSKKASFTLTSSVRSPMGTKNIYVILVPTIWFWKFHRVSIHLPWVYYVLTHQADAPQALQGS